MYEIYINNYTIVCEDTDLFIHVWHDGMKRFSIENVEKLVFRRKLQKLYLQIYYYEKKSIHRKAIYTFLQNFRTVEFTLV
jgi:hypothetical protein